MHQTGQDGRKVDTAPRKMVEVSPFQIITERNPKRRNTGCATIFISIDPAELAKVIHPALHRGHAEAQLQHHGPAGTASPPR